MSPQLHRHQVHAPHVPAERMELGPGDAAVLKNGLGRLEDGHQVPGEEIQIAAVEAGGPAQEGDGVLPGLLRHGLLEGVPEVHDLLGPVLSGEAVQRIDEEPRRNAVGVEGVHGAAFRFHVVVDEGRQPGRTGKDIRPPVRVRVLIGFQLIGQIAIFQIVRSVPVVGQAQVF